jgi:hypothetical protein
MLAAADAGEPVGGVVNVAKIMRALADETSSTRLNMLVGFGAANYHWF